MRVYIGKGATTGLNRESFEAQLKSTAGIEPSELKRLSIRDRYSFADFSEEVGQAVIDKLNSTDAATDGLVVKRATVITSTIRPNASASQTTEQEGAIEGDSNGGEMGQVESI